MRYAIITAAAALVLAAPAAAEDWDFILINDSGKEIKTIELAPNGTTDWKANRTEENEKPKPVKAGGRTTVHFDKTGCSYDVKATFADDTTETWSKINVCDNAFVTIRYRNGAPVVAVN